MRTIMITGTNRGIGLELVKQYVNDDWKVIATCRNLEKAHTLQEMVETHEHLLTVELDVTDNERITKLAEELKDESIDILFNNAGVYGSKGNSLDGLTKEEWFDVLAANTMSPIFMSRAFLPHVKRGSQKVIANMTSKMGSVSDNTSGGSYVYRTSKAALNQATKSLSIDVAADGITAVVLHPGWVKTDMGGPNGLIDTEECVTGLRKVLDGLSPADAGKFFDFRGDEISW
jgi:NAD(P)-dependent dehydrogenase (short-subunit alcohol dehydrogenase family)